MADPNALLHDPRRRNLAILALIAALMSGLAVLALMHQASLVAPKYTPTTVFPGLASHHHAVARIRVVSKKYGAFDVAFKPSAGWVLPGQHDYPASFSEVRKTIVGMASLETIRPQTKRAAWLHYLDLIAPAKGGKGTAITLYDEHGHVLASMIAGKTKDIGDPGGASGLFIRKPDSTQSWLVRSVFTPKPDPKDWMNKDVVDVDRASIQEVDVTPPSGPAYVVRRAKPSQSDFTLVDMPKGRQLAYPTSPDGVADSLVGFSFDKVRPVHTIDFSKAATLVTKTFGGLTVTAEIAKVGSDYWVKLSAEAPNAKREVRKQAAAIDKHASGWAFQVPAYKGAQFTTTRDSLLKTPEKKAKARK